MRKRIRDLVVGDRVNGVVLICEVCEDEYIGRADSKYCSDRCRQAAYRGRK